MQGSEILSFAEGLSRVGPALAGIIIGAVLVYGMYLLRKKYDRDEIEKRIKYDASELEKRKEEWKFDQEKRHNE